MLKLVNKSLLAISAFILAGCAGITSVSTKMPTPTTTVNSYTEWYNLMNKAINNFETEVSVKIPKYSANVYDIYKLPYPDVQISAKGQTITKSTGETYSNLYYTIKYKQNLLLTKAAEDRSFLSHLTAKDQKLFKQAQDIAASIIKSGMTPYEKEKAIHDYMVLNYKYDTSVVFDNSPDNYGPAYRISGLLENKTGCCEAYTAMFKLLGTLAGLDVKVAYGCIGKPKATRNGKPVNTHAWNIIKLDGEYYHIDVTSDDPVPDVKGRIDYTFFNVSDSELAKTHTYDKSSSGNISCQGTKYNFFKYNNLYVNSINEFGALIKREVAKKSKTIYAYTRGFGVKTKNEVQSFFDTKVVSSFGISGEAGKAGIYVVTVEYR
ncbi:MAG: hypothetical protein J6Y82_03280 [Bacteroidales bacterium]|nr:hypothetical protein [Bacteroidales bacterium]